MMATGAAMRRETAWVMSEFRYKSAAGAALITTSVETGIVCGRRRCSESQNSNVTFAAIVRLPGGRSRNREWKRESRAPSNDFVSIWKLGSN
jgi:hypothetical protein